MSEKITILMPVYNRENFIMRAIFSILNQSYENIELIIYDDGSTDNTQQIIMKLQSEDDRIQYHFGAKNHGVGHARNKLLDLCKTEYACWMDSDDFSYPDRIKRQVSELPSYSLIFGQWENMTKKKIGTTLGFATLMFKVDKNIRFKEGMQWGGEDWDWIERMRQIGTSEICIKEVMYSIDFHGDRIGTWKRKLCKDWGGVFTPEELQGLTYSEAIKKFNEKNNE